MIEGRSALAFVVLVGAVSVCAGAAGLLSPDPTNGRVLGPLLIGDLVLLLAVPLAMLAEGFGRASPRAVAIVAAAAGLPWALLALGTSLAQLVALPTWWVGLSYGTQAGPTRDLPVVVGWNDARVRFAHRRRILGRHYRWRVAVLAIPASLYGLVALLTAAIVATLGVLPASAPPLGFLAWLFLPLVSLFVLPVAVAGIALVLAPLARRPTVRHLRSLWHQEPRPRGIGLGNTLVITTLDGLVLALVVLWGLTEVLGAFSPVSLASLAVLAVLVPMLMVRTLWLDVAVLTEGPVGSVARVASRALAGAPLEVLRLLGVQLVVGGGWVLLVVAAAGVALLGVDRLVPDPWAEPAAAGTAVAMMLGAWWSGASLWVFLALHRLAVTARILSPPAPGASR